MSDITIHEFEVAYQMAGIRQDAALARSRLDRIAREQFVQGWDRYIDDVEAEESYCYIDHLELELTLNLAATDDGAIAHRWATRIYDAINKKIRSGVGVVVFRNRAHYLAAYVTALLRGTAWSDPCFEGFRRYSALDPGTAAVQVLTAEPESGPGALLLLCETGQLPPLMESLSDESAHVLWTRCLASETPVSIFTGAYSLWVRRLLAFLRGNPLARASESKELVTLYLELLRAYPDLGPDRNLAVFLRQLVHFRHVHFFGKRVNPPPGSENEPLGRGLEPSEQFLQRMVAKVGEAESSALLRHLTTQAPLTAANRIFSRASGIYLLFPIIEDCQLTSFCRTVEPPLFGGVRQESLLRYLLALEVLGHFRHSVLKDSGLLLFAGLDQAPEWTFIEEYAQSLTRDVHDSMLAWIRKRKERLEREYQRPDTNTQSHALKDLSFLPIDRLSTSTAELRALDETLAAFSDLILQEFTRRIGAFSESTVDFLARNFFVLDGEIELDSEFLTVHFISCPLQVLLRMTGICSGERRIPHSENRILRFVFPGG